MPPCIEQRLVLHSGRLYVHRSKSQKEIRKATTIPRCPKKVFGAFPKFWSVLKYLLLRPASEVSNDHDYCHRQTAARIAYRTQTNLKQPHETLRSLRKGKRICLFDMAKLRPSCQSLPKCSTDVHKRSVSSIVFRFFQQKAMKMIPHNCDQADTQPLRHLWAWHQVPLIISTRIQ